MRGRGIRQALGAGAAAVPCGGSASRAQSHQGHSGDVCSWHCCHDATSRAPTHPHTHPVATCPSTGTGATHQLDQPSAASPCPGPAQCPGKEQGGTAGTRGSSRAATGGPHSPPAPPRWSLVLCAPYEPSSQGRTAVTVPALLPGVGHREPGRWRLLPRVGRG